MRRFKSSNAYHCAALVLAGVALTNCGSSSDKVATESETASSQEAVVSSKLVALRKVALEHAAKRLGRDPGSLDAGQGALASLPHVGRSLARFKVVGSDARSAVDIDVATGQPVADGNALVEEELKAARAERGKLGASLRARLQNATSRSEAINVVMWLQVKTDPNAPSPKTTTRRGSAPLAAPVAARATFLRGQETAAVRGRVLNQLKTIDSGARVDAVSPVAYARVRVSEVAALESWPDVVDIDLDDVVSPELDVVSDALDYRPEVHQDLGFRGNGQMIGQVEAGGNNLKAATHPCLDNITQSGTTNALHATQVAGVLVCSDATRTGLAPDAQLFIRSGSLDSDIQNATTAAREWGANAINLSLGSPATDDTPNSFDKFLDDIVWTHWRTVVKSAGNTGNHLTHPGLGYNTFTVGGANDGNTVSRIGDTMYSSSAYINPKSSNSDRQKPEVVAFAVNINMPNNSSGFSDNSGTSFAAPQVTGTAALMMEAASNLQGWPEIIKATIMATARFNIEGDARLSDYDGAGAIDTRGAVDVVRNGGPSNSNYLGDGVSCGSSWPREYTMSLTAGKATRAVIVWDQDPNYANYVSQPAVDLDLEIVQPNGSWLVRSNSYDNTYEIASFTPPVTGTYIARVVNWRCDASPLGIGFAWYQDP